METQNNRIEERVCAQYVRYARLPRPVLHPAVRPYFELQILACQKLLVN